MICFNGINGLTGCYLFEPTDEKVLLDSAHDLAVAGNAIAKLTAWSQKPVAGLPWGVSPEKITEAGWGVVFYAKEREEVKAAIGRLVELRSTLVPKDKVKVLTYNDGEEVPEWLARYGMGVGDVDPTKVPYYLLVVGDPAKIPFEFVQNLALGYCVGCIHFDETDDYSHYVDAVLRYETSVTSGDEPDVMIFAPRHDPATRLSCDYLAAPLCDQLSRSFEVCKLLGGDATKQLLVEKLTVKPPSLFFSASHGLGFPVGYEKQLARQGALVCQEWQGQEPPQPQQVFSAEDVGPDWNLSRTIFFHFACFSCGTPENDRFLRGYNKEPIRLAVRAFYSALSKRLLSKESNASLAVLGHVDRAWGHSILAGGEDPQLIPFKNAIYTILSGQPVGLALKDFRDRYAAYSVALTRLMSTKQHGGCVPEEKIARTWIRRNDAEGYLLFGDPAVRLRTRVNTQG